MVGKLSNMLRNGDIYDDKEQTECLNRSWYEQECKFDREKRRKEYNRKVRHMKIDEDACSRGYVKQFRHLEWNTAS